MKHKLIRKHTGEEFDCLNEIWDFIEMKPSSLEGAGSGVFALQDIPNNIILSWYKGFNVNHSINSAYCWNYKSDIDGKRYKLEADLCITSNPLAYVNSFANEEQKKLLNCERIIINERIYYKTIKKIKKGEELIVDYKNKKYFTARKTK